MTKRQHGLQAMRCLNLLFVVFRGRRISRRRYVGSAQMTEQSRELRVYERNAASRLVWQ